MGDVGAELVFIETKDQPWQWRRVGGGFRNNVTGSTTQAPPAGLLVYWLRKAVILLEKKFESLDNDQSGCVSLRTQIRFCRLILYYRTLNINELVTSAASETVRKSLRDLFKEVSLQSSGELNFSEVRCTVLMCPLACIFHMLSATPC